MSEEYIVHEGPTCVYKEDEILIDGASLSPLDVLRAAETWLELAKSKGWSLKDVRGNTVIWDKS